MVTLNQIESRLRDMNSRFHTRIFLEKNSGKYCFHWYDEEGVIQMTLNVAAGAKYSGVFEALRLFSNLFI